MRDVGWRVAVEEACEGGVCEDALDGPVPAHASLGNAENGGPFGPQEVLDEVVESRCARRGERYGGVVGVVGRDMRAGYSEDDADVFGGLLGELQMFGDEELQVCVGGLNTGGRGLLGWG
jgi:hypothetical protein